MVRVHFNLLLATMSLAIALPACGGSSSTISPPAPSSAPSASTLTSLSITVPAASSPTSATRTPRSLAAPQSVALATQSGVKTTVVLAASNPNCAKDATGALVCTTQLPLAPGVAQVGWTMYASADASGAALASGTVAAVIAATGSNAVAITIGGAVRSLGLVLAPNTATTGRAQTSMLVVNAIDASGKLIVGGAGYVDLAGNALSISLTDSDRSGVTFLSKTAIGGPGDGATLQYTGSAAVSATLTASLTLAASGARASGVADATATFSASGAASGAVTTPGGGSAVAGSPIQHVVIVIMENRSFDNMFNGFPNADTAQSGLTHDGKTVALVPTPFELPPDPSHERKSLLTEYNNGKMDGFDLDPVGSTIAGPPNLPSPNTFVYGYLPQAETLPYWTLAKRYAVADRMFASQLAPSFPGHQYLIAGQSGRAVGNPVNVTNPVSMLQVNAVWGCDSPAGSTIELLDGSNNEVLPGPFPCFDYPTLGDRLDSVHVSWKYYTGFANGFDLDGQVSAYDAIKHIRYGPDWNANVVSPEYRFFDDVATAALPAVTWITPPAAASDHAGSMNSSGPSWVSAIYSAIAASPYAANTAILVTWDDSGGWYDHVAPPQFNGLELGFRVPLIAISPYTKSGYVSHVTHDYGSILHFIEKNFGAASLGTVDARADDLSDMFDFTQAPLKPLTLAAPYSLADIRSIKATHPVDDDH